MEEVEDIKEMFRMMDTDNDGAISFDELKAGIQKFGSQLAEAEVQMLVEAVCMFQALSYGMIQFTIVPKNIYHHCLLLPTTCKFTRVHTDPHVPTYVHPHTCRGFASSKRHPRQWNMLGVCLECGAAELMKVAVEGLHLIG